MRKVKFHLPFNGSTELHSVHLEEREGYTDGQFYYHKERETYGGTRPHSTQYYWVVSDIQSGRMLMTGKTRKSLEDRVNNPDDYTMENFNALRFEKKYQDWCRDYSELLRKYGVAQ